MKQLTVVLAVAVMFGFCLTAEAAGINEGFDNFQNGVRPLGWTFRNCNANSDAYTVSGYFGNASPSLLLDSSTDDIWTTEIVSFADGTDATLSFWTRSLASNPSSSFMILANVSETWTLLTDIYGLSDTAVTYGPLSLNASTSQLKFSYNKSSANMVLDDIVIAGAITPAPSATPVPGATPQHYVIDGDDYNGDGFTDYALYRPSTGAWYIDGITEGVVWGDADGDIIASGDYNGDGTADMAYFNRFSTQWFVKDGIGGALITSGLEWGRYGSWPVPGDYNGDGITDYAVWDIDSHGVGRWLVMGESLVDWGKDGDIPVPGDYDGDGTADFATWRPSNGKWYIRPADGSDPYALQWGWSATLPVPGDFDGDGITDAAVYWPRATSTTWFMVRNIGKYNWGWVDNKEDTAAIGNFQAPAPNAGIAIFRAWTKQTGQGAWYIYGGSPIEVTVTGETGDVPAVGQPY